MIREELSFDTFLEVLTWISYRRRNFCFYLEIETEIPSAIGNPSDSQRTETNIPVSLIVILVLVIGGGAPGLLPPNNGQKVRNQTRKFADKKTVQVAK